MINTNYEPFTYDRCPICGEFGWLQSHKCPPVWRVALLGDEDILQGDVTLSVLQYDICSIWANGAEDAATRYFEQMDGWYEVSGIRVAVIADGDFVMGDDFDGTWPGGKYEVFDVSVEAVPVFHATRVELEAVA